MRVSATGFDPDDPACPNLALLKRLQRAWPELTPCPAIDPAADVLVVLLDRQSGPRLFAHGMPSDTTVVVGVVLELHRATLPLLKLCDTVIYTNAYQRRVVEGLLGLRYDFRILPLPSGGFPVTPRRRGQQGDLLIWFDAPFDATRVADYHADVLRAVSWHPDAELADLRVVFEVPPAAREAFAAFSRTLEATPAPPTPAAPTRLMRLRSAVDRALDRVSGEAAPAASRFVTTDRRGLSLAQVRALIAPCARAQFFSDGLSRDQFDTLFYRRDPALVDHVIADRQVLADLAFARVPMARVTEIAADNVQTGRMTTDAAFASTLRACALEDHAAIVERHRTRFADAVPDTLADLHLVHGAPLANAFVFSVCLRNQEQKLARCLASIARQNRAMDVGVVIVDDASTDRSCQVALDVLADLDEPLDACVVSNRTVRRAARNLYNVAHLLTTRDDTVIIELDGDDALHGERVLETLQAAYAAGAAVTRGSYQRIPPAVGAQAAAQAAEHAAMDFTDPWNLATCTAWLHLRSCRRALLRQVELRHFCDRRTGTWLTARHDAAIQPRVIELADGACTFIDEVLYVYDVSGGNHDHDEHAREEEMLRLFGDLDRIWHPLLLSEGPER